MNDQEPVTIVRKEFSVVRAVHEFVLLLFLATVVPLLVGLFVRGVVTSFMAGFNLFK